MHRQQNINDKDKRMHLSMLSLTFALLALDYPGISVAEGRKEDKILVVDGTNAARNDAPCIEDSKFYRNPNTLAHVVWASSECAKYYLCLDNEVFEFKCSEGLLFDVFRQICDYQLNVDNCDVTLQQEPPKPLLEKGECAIGGMTALACGDGTCLPNYYFCDGSVDCPDGSDEAWCPGDKNDYNTVGQCDSKKCELPDCWCSTDGKQIPGNLSISEVPQMITITFDDAVNADNFHLYAKLFDENRKNPNGCPIRGTFFVSHQYTNYRDVQYLWNTGHEIAAHSVTHRGPEEWWSNNATIEDWFDEMVGIANIINRYGAVRMKDIRGLRVPFLRVGWNRQFLMMSEFGFLYDSSIIAPYSDPPIWPYTLDYKSPHECATPGQLCPSRAYPGLWEVPLNELVSGEYTCPTVEACAHDMTSQEIYEMLMVNFERHYATNRAPLGLHLNAAWLLENHDNLDALTKFIDNLLRLPDVYFVTSNRVIEWMREPTALRDIPNSETWQCHDRQFKHYEIACDVPNSCKLPSRVLDSHRYLETCFDCPERYPWLRNEFGTDR